MHLPLSNVASQTWTFSFLFIRCCLVVPFAHLELIEFAFRRLRWDLFIIICDCFLFLFFFGLIFHRFITGRCATVRRSKDRDVFGFECGFDLRQCLDDAFELIDGKGDALRRSQRSTFG